VGLIGSGPGDQVHGLSVTVVTDEGLRIMELYALHTGLPVQT